MCWKAINIDSPNKDHQLGEVKDTVFQLNISAVTQAFFLTQFSWECEMLQLLFWVFEGLS